MPGPQWYPGDLAVGTRVNPEQNLFVKPPLMQSGVATTAPTAATPGTVASGGTVSNTLGYDVAVYASSTTGISASKVGTVSIPGSALSGETVTYMVPYGSSVTISYTGTLTWVWLAK